MPIHASAMRAIRHRSSRCGSLPIERPIWPRGREPTSIDIPMNLCACAISPGPCASPSRLAYDFRKVHTIPLTRYALALSLRRAATLLSGSDDLARLAVNSVSSVTAISRARSPGGTASRQARIALACGQRVKPVLFRHQMRLSQCDWHALATIGISAQGHDIAVLAQASNLRPLVFGRQPGEA